jgi:hypothetical protein
MFTVATPPANGTSARTASGLNQLPQIREHSQLDRERVRHRARQEQNRRRRTPTRVLRHSPNLGSPAFSLCRISRSQNRRPQTRTRVLRHNPSLGSPAFSLCRISLSQNRRSLPHGLQDRLRRRSRQRLRIRQFSPRPTIRQLDRRNHPRVRARNPARRRFSRRRPPDSIAMQMRETGHAQQGRHHPRRERRRRITRGNRSRPIIHAILRRTINRRRVRTTKTSGSDNRAIKIEIRAPMRRPDRFLLRSTARSTCSSAFQGAANS